MTAVLRLNWSLILTVFLAAAAPTVAGIKWQGGTELRITRNEERLATIEQLIVTRRDSNQARFGAIENGQTRLEAGQAEIMRILEKIERKLGL